MRCPRLIAASALVASVESTPVSGASGGSTLDVIVPAAAGSGRSAGYGECRGSRSHDRQPPPRAAIGKRAGVNLPSPGSAENVPSGKNASALPVSAAFDKRPCVHAAGVAI
jgi:hypothetical protein